MLNSLIRLIFLNEESDVKGVSADILSGQKGESRFHKKGR